MSDLGPLFAALAKAQTQFTVVKRDKTVTVQTKTGGSYSFSYAPLDTILEAVRKPLSANGLTLVQMLDDGTLVTSLGHESGAVLSGRVDLPQTADIQAFGSAITYLRRYAIQAMLGIAAEDDDDGNHAAGNIASPSGRSSSPARRAPAAAPSGGGGDGPYRGAVSRGPAPADGSLRETPEGPVFGFTLTEPIPGSDRGRKVQVIAEGALATALGSVFDGTTEATVWGELVMVPWQKDGRDMPPYRRVIASRVQTPDFTVPAAVMAPESSENELDGLAW